MCMYLYMEYGTSTWGPQEKFFSPCITPFTPTPYTTPLVNFNVLAVFSLLDFLGPGRGRTGGGESSGRHFPGHGARGVEGISGSKLNPPH